MYYNIYLHVNYEVVNCCATPANRYLCRCKYYRTVEYVRILPLVALNVYSNAPNTLNTAHHTSQIIILIRA